MDEHKIEKKKLNKEGQIYFINGVKVPFPVKAYPTQITMMNKVSDRKLRLLFKTFVFEAGIIPKIMKLKRFENNIDMI